MSQYGVFSGPYFPAFGLNTEQYEPQKTPYLDTFYAVKIYLRKESWKWKRENINRNNTEQYLRFIWNYEKEEEEEEKDDMDKRLAKTKIGKGSIQQRY